MSTPAAALYNLIKSNESKFPIPAPYFTVNVGTFNAAAGTFSGLTTTVDFNPEPLPHSPNQKPIIPAPKYVGARWVSVGINAKFQETTTSVPAPQVPLAPVLLEFSITNASAGWSVTVGGTTVSAPATQTSLTVSIWDTVVVGWSIKCGSKSHSDRLQIQRPGGISDYGVGAFTIPVVPVAIVYAPPADSLNKSVATYTQGSTIGTTVTNSFETDTSNTVPQYTAASNFKAGLDTLTKVLSGLKDTVASDVVSGISAQFGTISHTMTTGISDLSETQMTVTQSTSSGISTVTTAGGPGSGDVFHFYKNVMMAWSLQNGALSLTPLGFTQAAHSAAEIKNNLAAVGISAEDAQMLLSLDPFATGGAQAALPTDRYMYQQTWDYGGGVTLPSSVSLTRNTKTTDTTKSFTTTTSSWDPGPIFQLLGFGGKQTTTTTISNATGTDVTSTISLNATLVAGPTDHFVVNVWYDNLFGTFAFQEVPPATSPVMQGTGATPGDLVTLVATGGKIFRTVADSSGKYAFHAPNIPAGAATMIAGRLPSKKVTVPKM